MPIAVVTDSTAYLPEALAERFRVRIVPLRVSVEGATAVDEIEFGPDELASALASKRRVTTSGAASAEFASVYRRALNEGAEGVVSVHLSRRLSSTWDAARLAAHEVDPALVRVVDSRSTAMGLGFSVLAGANRAEAGASLSAVESAVALAAERTTTVFSVQTLDYLRRGGRIGTAAAVLGTALAMKPLLHVRGGKIELLEKVRTTSRAVDRLREIAARSAGAGSVAIAVHHLAAAERARRLAAEIEELVPMCGECVVSEVGAVIGAHVGPGSVGIVVSARGRGRA